MEDILLQAIIDKLETLDKTTEKLTEVVNCIPNYSASFTDLKEKIRTVQMEVRGIPEQISIPGKEIIANTLAMDDMLTQLKRPLNQKIKHIHYLDAPLLLCIAMTTIVIGLSFWINILYDKIQGIEKIPNDQLVISSHDIQKNQSIAKRQRLNPKILVMYGGYKDSLARSNKMMKDSVYNGQMNKYEQKGPDIQQNLTSQTPKQVKKSKDLGSP
jgi:hypothetical protein